MNRECNGLPVQLLFDLFDKLLLPKLVYCCEIDDTLFKVKLKRFKECFVNMFYMFHIKHLKLRCFENVEDSHRQFILFLPV